MKKAKPQGILTRQINEYLHELQRPRDEVLAELERDAEKNEVGIIGPLCGSLLSLLATSCKARNILEIGTATGYSGIWLGRVAKQNGGKLITIENDHQRQAIAVSSFGKAGIAENVEITAEDAVEAVPRIARERRGEFDIVFLDLNDKSLYLELLEHCISAVRVGGYFVADNTLWRGLVSVRSNRDKVATIIRKFNMLMFADERLLPVIVPLRDGMTVALKVSERRPTIL